MFNFLRSFWDLYHRHWAYMMLPFQPIVRDPQLLVNIREQKYRYHYLFPLSVTSAIILDTIINSDVYGGDVETSLLFYHVIMSFMPKMYLETAHIVFIPVYGLAFTYMFACLFDTFPHVDFILLRVEGRLIFPFRKPSLANVNRQLSKKLIDFYDRYRKLMRKVLTVLRFNLDLGFCFPSIAIESYKIYTTSGSYITPARVIILLIGCAFFCSSVVGSIHIGFQFIAENYFIQIKQRHYLSTMAGSAMLTGKKGYFRWRKCIGRILDLTREISFMNRFYSKYSTTIIGFFGALGCLLLNVSIQMTHEAPLLMSLPWYSFGVIYLLFTLLICMFCSKTQSLNMGLFKSLRLLQTGLLSCPGLNFNQIVKLDLVNEYKTLLQKCSFRLLNASQINNKLFAFQIFGCVSVFWMKLVANDSFARN